MCTFKFQGGLGFKKIGTFNFALLAKQGWHILQNETSMLHQIYKVRYFSKIIFFNQTWAKIHHSLREVYGKPKACYIKVNDGV